MEVLTALAPWLVGIVLILALAWLYARATGTGAAGRQAKKELKEWGDAVEKGHRDRRPLDWRRPGDAWRRLRNRKDR